jgi:hypothetical protein
LSEYGPQAEDLITAMQKRIDTLDAEWGAQTPTVEGARTYWDARIEARTEMLEGFAAIDPPDEIAELNAVAVGPFEELTAAEEALAVRAAAFETVAGHGPWWDTPEGQAARAADERMIGICNAAQAEFDKTEKREATADVPWLPSDLKEVVRVAFGCPA